MQRTEFPEIGEVLYSCRLANGLELRVVPKRDFATFYAAFATNYGGAHRCFTLNGERKETPAGVAHFLEHKMFDLPNGDNALSMLTESGADPNAFTSSSMTCYYFQCTAGFEGNLRLLLHFVSTPYFTEETVAKEQGIIAQEIRMGEDNPGIAVYYNLLGLLYACHPIRDRVAGTVESISEITAETLYDCHKAFYAPSNMVLCVEGDVDPEQIRRIAEEVLGSECAPVPAADFGEKETLFPAAQYRCETMAVSAPQFLLGVKLPYPAAGEERVRQGLTASLALRMLCGSSSPFYSRLYSAGLLTGDFDYEVDDSAGTVTVIVGGESKDPKKVLEEFTAEAARIAAEGFDAAAFTRSCRASVGARLRGLEDFDNVCVSLAAGVFEDYCALDTFRILNTITAEDCRRFVAENLVPDRLAMSVIAPPAADCEVQP